MDSVNEVESLVSCGIFFTSGRIDGIIKFSSVEDSAGFVQEEENVEEHIESQEPSSSVREVDESHMSLIFEVVFFFQVDVITRHLENQVFPQGPEEMNE